MCVRGNTHSPLSASLCDGDPDPEALSEFSPWYRSRTHGFAQHRMPWQQGTTLFERSGGFPTPSGTQILFRSVPTAYALLSSLGHAFFPLSSAVNIMGLHADRFPRFPGP